MVTSNPSYQASQSAPVIQMYALQRHAINALHCPVAPTLCVPIHIAAVAKCILRFPLSPSKETFWMSNYS